MFSAVNFYRGEHELAEVSQRFVFPLRKLYLLMFSAVNFHRGERELAEVSQRFVFTLLFT